MRRLELSQIQGFILRGYPLKTVRYFVLQVDNAAAARAFLGCLVQGKNAHSLQLTTADAWSEAGAKPDYALNAGITWPGLVELGAKTWPDLSFESFPSFIAGSKARADLVSDIGDSAPAHWVGGLGSGNDHVLLSLYASDNDALERYSQTLREQFAANGALRELSAFTGGMLPNGRVHFGYRDGISQPTIEGAPAPNIPDAQPVSLAWNFVLLDDPEAWYNLPTPTTLGRNGSFGVFRILRQDVAAFEQFLAANRAFIDPELLAAKMCGRWRNGVPLALSPDAATPNPAIPESEWNNFDYVPSALTPGGFDDRAGLRTPLGSHLRRVNPRGEIVQGGGGHDHRLVRRGLPYGPPFDPNKPDDQERGLLGFFINASIEKQFEFVMQAWINDGGFTPGLPRGETDPVTGAQDTSQAFTIPQTPPAAPLRIPGLSRFVTTRGSAYCFLPSVAALQLLASIGMQNAREAG